MNGFLKESWLFSRFVFVYTSFKSSGKLSIASERLNIHPDVLKSWKRNYLQVQKERRANMKKMKGKNYVTLIQRCPPSSVKKLTQFLPQKYSSKAATVAKTNSSLNARKIAQKSIFKSIQRVKQRSVSPRTISSSKEQVFMGKHYDDIRVETGNSSSKIEKNSAKQKPDLPPKKLGYILEPSADPNFRENFYVIFDKGASEMSSSDAATEPDFLSDGQAFLAGGQRVVPKDVSLFVCEGCRQIFRFSNTFKSHMKSFCAIPQKDEKRQIFLWHFSISNAGGGGGGGNVKIGCVNINSNCTVFEWCIFWGIYWHLTSKLFNVVFAETNG